MDGSEFKPNDDNKMYTPNGQYYLVFQTDGNLVMYKEGEGKSEAIWASHDSTKHKYDLNTADKLVFQTDGNMVIYDKGGKPLWASDTDEHSGKCLILSNEGRLFIIAEISKTKKPVSLYSIKGQFLDLNKQRVWFMDGSEFKPNDDNKMYTPSFDAVNGLFPILDKLVWFMDGSEFKPNNHRMYTPNGQYYLVFQTDGNLAMYKEGGDKIWASHDSHKHKYDLNTADKLVFQTDGNMVIYDKDGKPLWVSDTDCIYETHSGMFIGDGSYLPDPTLETHEEWKGKCLILTDEGELVLIGENTKNPKNIKTWGATKDKGKFDTGLTNWEQFGIGLGIGVGSAVLGVLLYAGGSAGLSYAARVIARRGLPRVLVVEEEITGGVMTEAGYGDTTAFIHSDATSFFKGIQYAGRGSGGINWMADEEAFYAYHKAGCP